MNDDAPSLQQRLEELRHEFDRAFAIPAHSKIEQAEDLLAIRVEGDAYALRVVEIAGIFKEARITPVSSPVQSLRGIAGIQNGIVPVHSLAAILGYPQSERSCAWLVLCRTGAGSESIALAFSEFIGWLRASASSIHAVTTVERPHIDRIVSVDGTMCYMVNVPSIVAAILGFAKK